MSGNYGNGPVDGGGGGPANSPDRRRPQVDHRVRSFDPGVAGSVGGTDDAWRPRSRRLRWTCRSTRNLRPRNSNVKGHRVGERTVARLLHRAGTVYSPIAKSARASRTRTATSNLSTSTPRSWRFQTSRATGHFGGHQEEGIGGGFPERRAGMAAAGRTGRGSRSRLPGQDAGQGDSLRRLRRDAQPRMGQRGHRPRHRADSPRSDSPLVAEDGRRGAFPMPTKLADHRRRRREQRLPLRDCGKWPCKSWPTRSV